MKTYQLTPPFDATRVSGLFLAAGIAVEINSTGVIHAPDSTDDAQAAGLIAQAQASPRTPRTLASIKPLLTPALVTRLYLSAKLWAYAQDDFALHDLANRSADSSTALLLVATWLQSNPSGAQAQGINLRGDQ